MRVENFVSRNHKKEVMECRDTVEIHPSYFLYVMHGIVRYLGLWTMSTSQYYRIGLEM